MMAEFEDDMYDNGNWVPPTDAELKVIAARRERQDKVSKLLGEYLLKGYKMLGTSCTTCETIIMRSKQGVDYCVACNELDSDTTKDDPALSSAAARSQAREGQEKLNQDLIETRQLMPSNELLDYDEPDRTPRAVPRTNELLRHGEPDRLQSYPSHGSISITNNIVSDLRSTTNQYLSPMEIVNGALTAIHDQIAMATNKLRQSDNVETSRQQCQLIKDSAEAALSLKRLLS